MGAIDDSPVVGTSLVGFAQAGLAEVADKCGDVGLPTVDET